MSPLLDDYGANQTARAMPNYRIDIFVFYFICLVFMNSAFRRHRPQDVDEKLITNQLLSIFLSNA
jgi:hypothetical protein